MNGGATGPVAVIPAGPVTGATLLWRAYGRLHITIAVKATLRFVPDGTMTIAEPATVTADELVPFRPRADMIVTAAHARASRPVLSHALRLALQQPQAPIDKALLVYARRPGGVAQPFQDASIVRPDGSPPEALVVNPVDPSRRGSFGPLTTQERTEALGDTQPPAFDRDVLQCPDGLPWDYFQCAPPDQRTDYLLGNEWLMMAGMHAGTDKLQMRLPGGLAEARVFPPNLYRGNAYDVPLHIDHLSIDADLSLCSLVWRGAFAVGDEDTARALVIIAGLSLPSRPTRWPMAHEVRRAQQATSQTAYTTTLRESATDREVEVDPKTAELLERLGPLADMPLDGAPSDAAAREASELSWDPNGVLSLTLPTDGRFAGGTLPMDVNPAQLALLDLATKLYLWPLAGAPWDHPFGASPRGPCGTFITEQGVQDKPPKLPEQNVDVLEQTLSDSLGELDPNKRDDVLEASEMDRPHGDGGNDNE